MHCDRSVVYRQNIEQREKEEVEMFVVLFARGLLDVRTGYTSSLRRGAEVQIIRYEMRLPRLAAFQLLRVKHNCHALVSEIYPQDLYVVEICLFILQ